VVWVRRYDWVTATWIKVAGVRACRSCFFHRSNIKIDRARSKEEGEEKEECRFRCGEMTRSRNSRSVVMYVHRLVAELSG